MPGRNVRRMLAEAVAGGKCGAHALGVQLTPCRHADREDCRLGVFGEKELVFRSVETQPAQGLAQRIVCLAKRVPTHGKPLRERFSHTDFLGALAGKEEGEAQWGIAWISRAIFSSRFRSGISQPLPPHFGRPSATSARDRRCRDR